MQHHVCNSRPSQLPTHAAICSVRAVCTADYSWSLRGLDGEALAEAKSACHLRSARRLVDVAFANGAIYIKAGQHIGQLVSSLFEAYATLCMVGCSAN